MNCWEFRKCPERTFQSCPAYPDRGLDCWKITGTKCNMGTIEKATINEKIEFCRTCSFYNEYAHKY
jgi:hypothetical protein